MATVRYPYATPAGMNSLGQDLTAADFEKALAETGRLDRSLRQRYAELIAFVNLGGVPGVVVRDYMDAANSLNQLLRMNLDMLEKAGGTGVVVPVPTVRVRRNFLDTDVLTPADLMFEPCPQPPGELGQWQGEAFKLAILAARAFIITTGLVWSADALSKILHGEEFAAQKQGYITQAKVAASGDYRLSQVNLKFDQLMRECQQKDPKLSWTQCASNVTAILSQFNKGLPKFEKLKAGKEGGLGFFGWLGVGVFFAALGTVGYVWFKHRGEQKVKVEVARRQYERTAAEAAESAE
jgi:hypothetical protein